MISEFFERKIMPKILRYSSQTSYVNCSLSLGTDGSSPLWWGISVSLFNCVLSLKKYDFKLNFKVILLAKRVGYDFKLNFIEIFFYKTCREITKS